MWLWEQGRRVKCRFCALKAELALFFGQCHLSYQSTKTENTGKPPDMMVLMISLTEPHKFECNASA